MALAPIGLGFFPDRFACGDDADDRISNPETVAHNKDPQFPTHSQHQDTVFVMGMIRVKVADRILIEENRLRFLERDAVLAPVCAILPFIPLEPQAVHTYIVHPVRPQVNRDQDGAGRTPLAPSIVGIAPLASAREKR